MSNPAYSPADWAREYPFTTTRVPDFLAITDAAEECEHGRLRTDTPENLERAGCTCFAPKPKPEPAKPATPVADEPPIEAAAVYLLDLPPFIQAMAADVTEERDRVLEELDKLNLALRALTEA